MSDLNSKGTKLQYYCEKKDAIPIKNLLVSAKHRFDKVASRCADRMKQLENALQESQLYFDSRTELIDWINSNLKQINDHNSQVFFFFNLGKAKQTLLYVHVVIPSIVF